MANPNPPSNRLSDRGIEPKHKIERVTTSEAIVRKKPMGKRIAEAFTGDDAHSTFYFVLTEVLIPAAKNTISEAVSQGVERMLFGASPRRGARTSSYSSYTPYNRISTPRSTVNQRPPWEEDRPRAASRSAREFTEIVLDSRAEADAVLDSLSEIISQYTVASLSDLYQMVGIKGSYTDDKWGWSDISNARVTRVRDGYLLDLPRPEPL